MEVRYVMSAPAASVPVMASVQDAAQQMKDAGVGAVFVVDDEDRLLGVVSDRDLALRIVAPGMSAQVRVDAVMTRNPVAVEAGDDVMAAYRCMRARQVRRIPVLSDGRLRGVVTFDDLFCLSIRMLLAIFIRPGEVPLRFALLIKASWSAGRVRGGASGRGWPRWQWVWLRGGRSRR